MKDEVLNRIDEAFISSPVTITMKGTPIIPQCGFSMRAAQSLQQTGVKFTYANLLEDMEIFQNLPPYADWSTLPQIFIGSEFIGGCDTTLEMSASGELHVSCEEAVTAAHTP